MITVGSFEAKTHLSSLLERVSAGEEVLITKHGRPVARLIKADTIDRKSVDEAISKLRALRKETRLDGLTWKELRDDGRR